LILICFAHDEQILQRSPRVQPLFAAVRVTGNKAAMSTIMNMNVLVAEPSGADWAAIAKGIRRQLPEASVLRVKDGEQALRFLFHRGLFTVEPPVPDLVLLAEELPLIPAAGVIARMRIDPRTRLTPVIVVRQDLEEESLEPYWDGQLRSAMTSICVTDGLEVQVAEAVHDLCHRYPPLPERQKELSFRQ